MVGCDSYACGSLFYGYGISAWRAGGGVYKKPQHLWRTCGIDDLTGNIVIR